MSADGRPAGVGVMWDMPVFLPLGPLRARWLFQGASVQTHLVCASQDNVVNPQIYIAWDIYQTLVCTP